MNPAQKKMNQNQSIDLGHSTVDENLIFPILLSSIVAARISHFLQHHTVFESMMLQDGINPFTIDRNRRGT